ncbi:MAG TPA: KGG domain-containing protein [Candidatus Saccharimonadales bacterium]
MASSNRGFASMDEDKQRAIASKGGRASSGNFANDPQRASKAGKKGAAAQPTEAKAEGGRNSHRNG